jgi:hypothetical protein
LRAAGNEGGAPIESNNLGGANDMSEPMRREDETEPEGKAAEGETGENQENELEAEQESAAAMDADVPQPPQADETTEGQPS